MKYIALAGLFVLLAVIAVGIRQANQPIPQQQQQVDTAKPTAATPNAVSIGLGIRRANELNAALSGVAARAFEPRPSTPLIAYSHDLPVNLTASDAAALQASSVEHRRRVVTLLYSGDGFKRAVVDGKYLRAGDRLPGGARVMSITDNSVLIRSPQGREVLHVPSARRVSGSGDAGVPR